MTDRSVHGGDIQTASRHFSIPIDQWLDLSTGISPFAYPDTSISSSSFTNMPYLQGAFSKAVKSYYGVSEFIAANGTQQIIAALPSVLDKLPVALPDLGYEEHAMAWRKFGAEVIYYPARNNLEAVKFIDTLFDELTAFHLVLINPNNPCTTEIELSTITRWSTRMSEGVRLIIDEAFIDIRPECSALNKALQNTIVLRSFGKFFGLPGLRLGFAFADQVLSAKLNDQIGLWQVNGPAQEIAARALSDIQWQENIRKDIVIQAEQNRQVWLPLFDRIARVEALYSRSHAELFSTYEVDSVLANCLYEHFGENGILLRLFYIDSKRAFIRIGLFDANNGEMRMKVKRVIDSAIGLISVLNVINKKDLSVMV